MVTKHRVKALYEAHYPGQPLNWSWVAAATGISRQTVAIWFRNDCLDKYDGQTVARWCRFFGVGVGELLTTEGDR